MRRDRRPPNRLMYETAAVLSVRTNTSLTNSSVRNCHKARCTANSSRQLMCQSSRGPVQSPEAACPLHVVPQPVLEASFVNTICWDICSKGTPAHRKTRSTQRKALTVILRSPRALSDVSLLVAVEAVQTGTEIDGGVSSITDIALQVHNDCIHAMYTSPSSSGQETNGSWRRGPIFSSTVSGP